MKEAIIQRINTICSKKAKSIRDFSSQIGINNSTLIQQLKGSRSLSLDIVNAILFTFEDISAEWLLRGEGSMLTSENEAINKGPHSHHISPQRYETMLNLLAEVTEDLKETVIENQKLYEEIEELKTKLKMPQSA